jgi:hypothetical protein
MPGVAQTSSLPRLQASHPPQTHVRLGGDAARLGERSITAHLSDASLLLGDGVPG